MKNQKAIETQLKYKVAHYEHYKYRLKNFYKELLLDILQKEYGYSLPKLLKKTDDKTKEKLYEFLCEHNFTNRIPEIHPYENKHITLAIWNEVLLYEVINNADDNDNFLFEDPEKLLDLKYYGFDICKMQLLEEIKEEYK